MNMSLEIAMLSLEMGSPAFAHFLMDEAGGSPKEFVLVVSLLVTLLTLLALAFDQTVLQKKA